MAALERHEVVRERKARAVLDKIASGRMRRRGDRCHHWQVGHGNNLDWTLADALDFSNDPLGLFSQWHPTGHRV